LTLTAPALNAYVRAELQESANRGGSWR
jgi:hypothetical protein